MASSSQNIDRIRAEVRRRLKELNLDYSTAAARTIRYLYQEECDETEIKTVNNDWLKRFALGRPATLSANILNALLRALMYDDPERVRWLLHAGYSPIAVSVTTLTEVEEAINHVTHLLHSNRLAADLVASAVARGQAEGRTNDELLEVVATSLSMALDIRRRR